MEYKQTIMNVEELDWACELEEALREQDWPLDGTGTFFVIYKDRRTEEICKEFWSGADLESMITDDGVAYIKFIEIDWIWKETYSCKNRVSTHYYF